MASRLNLLIDPDENIHVVYIVYNSTIYVLESHVVECSVESFMHKNFTSLFICIYFQNCYNVVLVSKINLSVNKGAYGITQMAECSVMCELLKTIKIQS